MALAAQIPHYQLQDDPDETDEIAGGGYWSSPEDRMDYLEGDAIDEDSPTNSELSSPQNEERTNIITRWSDSDML